MRIRLLCSIFIVLLFLPSVLLGEDIESTSATLKLVADFSHESNNRCIMGFTKQDVITFYEDVQEESSLDLEYDETSSSYNGEINVYYQMDNLLNVTAVLSIETPFYFTDNTIIPAVVNVETYIKGIPDTKGIDLYNNAENRSYMIYEKGSSTMRERGTLPIEFSINANDIDLSKMNITTTATLKLTVTTT